MNHELQTDRVVVEDGNGNRIFIRRKMGYGIRERIKSDMLRVTLDSTGERVSMPDVGLGNIAALTHNILGWEGPDIAQYKTVEALIDELDPEFGDAVREKIRDLNQPRQSPNANSATTNGSSTTGAGAPIPSAQNQDVSQAS